MLKESADLRESNRIKFIKFIELLSSVSFPNSSPLQNVTRDLASLANVLTMKKKFNGSGVYSKTYTQPTIQSQTLVVDNVRYHLAKNKKSMIKVGNNLGREQAAASRSAAKSSSAHRFNSASKPNKSIKSSPAKSIANKSRILKENNYQFVSRKSFKLVNKSKTKLILRRPNQFKFIRLNTAAVAQPTKSLSNKSDAKRPPDRYRKIYNQNSVPKSQDQLAKLQAAQQLRKKALKSSIICLNKKNNKLKLCTDNTIYCMFFCRFGRCAKIDTCKYKHDKDKVAVCKKLVVFMQFAFQFSVSTNFRTERR